MSALSSRAPILPLGALPRVDLLPPSEVRRRDMLRQARRWVYVAVAAAAVAAVTIAGAFMYNVATSLRLGFEQTRTQQILGGIAELSEVSQALSTRGALQQLRGQAMGGDLAWGPVIDLVAERLPPGVSITGYALDAGPVPAADVAPEDATGVSGTVTFVSPAAIDFVGTTRELRSAPGMRDADLAELTSADGIFTYRVRVDVDQTVYTGAFAPDEED
ncbi:hypothetical protein QSU92_10050 [Microbacterium sp. ET2]|uniref:hypothetical protein n=1 Tax=Microbacterium albipurpureum TaxID=3050384 RepID=UPI00259CE471|nr:hypothetical protein [Microbacterium sp. ET2 (Ac-2212)]WJL94332.1 hypothetical protein QSU92_10050 [Microbacterium sp. ET2 (Ac-2212)]